MKEKIYTIPVTEAFKVDCECPMCILEKKLEDEYIDYVLGPSLMEPDSRTITNDKGFCQKHYERLYATQANRLGLGLIIDTHLMEQNKRLKEVYSAKADSLKKESELSLMKNLSNKVTAKKTESEKLVEETITLLKTLEASCTVCSKLDQTMDRYVDVIIYLWFRESDFRELFTNKGFCIKHFRVLLEGAKKYLSGKDLAIFTNALFSLELDNLERVQQDVNWFTKKFDYRYNDAPWKNSKDAVPRSIQKIVGYSDLG